MRIWHHWVVALLIGYILGYYFPGIGKATVGRIIPYPGQMGG